MKLRLKRLIAIGVLSAVVFLVGWTFLDHIEKKESLRRLPLGAGKAGFVGENGNKANAEDIVDDEDFSDNLQAVSKGSCKKIDCLINDEYSVGCLKATDNSVFLPFSFLRKYYEVTGKLGKRADGTEYFSWQHSYSKVFFPREPYDYRGVFLWFDNYNVEVRDRVKYISAIHGVPVSSQWNAEGHFYPIQVAQFGLSHFSKNLTLGRPRVLHIEDGSFAQENWSWANFRDKGVTVKTVEDHYLRGDNEALYVEGSPVEFKVKKQKNNDLHLSICVKPLKDFSFVAHLQSIESGKEFSVFYTAIDDGLLISNGTLYYGIGKDATWKCITRDLGVDLHKSQSILANKVAAKMHFRLTRLAFRGKGLVDDVYLASSAHETHFKTAAKWLVETQDERGGWPVQVTRKLSNGELVLKPGWYSAMAQGQAMSLLTRMYLETKDSIYLESAAKGLNLFFVNSSDNGIRTYFLDKYVWFEEYPTVPSSFVLNGFMYSLFGLYDLKMTCRLAECERAASLFADGLHSLKKLITLFGKFDRFLIQSLYL